MKIAKWLYNDLLIRSVNHLYANVWTWSLRDKLDLLHWVGLWLMRTADSRRLKRLFVMEIVFSVLASVQQGELVVRPHQKERWVCETDWLGGDTILHLSHTQSQVHLGSICVFLFLSSRAAIVIVSGIAGRTERRVKTPQPATSATTSQLVQIWKVTESTN